MLKNTLRHAGGIPPASVEYVKTQLLLTIGAADQGVRKTVGSAISTLLEGGGVAGWPEILEAMVRCLDSGDYNHMEGAMDALSKVGFKACRSISSRLGGQSGQSVSHVSNTRVTRVRLRCVRTRHSNWTRRYLAWQKNRSLSFCHVSFR